MSTIKVIAPLSPAGEFPIADANNISLGSGGNTPKSGSVAAAVSELQQELGITAGVEGSVSAKLDYVKDNLDSKTSTTEITDTINEALTELKSLLGNTTDNPSLFTALKDLADDLNTLQEYIGRDTTEGLTKVLDTIYTRTGTLVECLGDTDEGIIGYINAMVSSIDSLLTKFESSISFSRVSIAFLLSIISAASFIPSVIVSALSPIYSAAPAFRRTAFLLCPFSPLRILRVISAFSAGLPPRRSSRVQYAKPNCSGVIS